MDDRELENKITSAYEDIAPDILDSVLRDCKEQKGRVIIMQNKKKKSLVRAVAGIAAALLIVCGGIFGLNAYNGSKAIASTVMLDVNPSIEIQVNKHEKVLAVKPLNEDAKKVVGTMDFSGSSLEITVNALIGSMLRNGYINDASNSILVTVDSKNHAAGAELQTRLMLEISDLLKSSNNPVALLGQTITPDKDITKLAEEYGITAGKAKLISQIVAQDPAYIFADLVPMTINELNLLSESRHMSLGDIETVGKASDVSYIGEEAAKAAALKHAGVDASAARNIECELDWEKGTMVYEVEFTANGYEYDYEINAKTGAVVKYEKEADDDDDRRPSSGSSGSKTGSGSSGSTAGKSYIGEAEAKKKALAHAGLSAGSIRDYECELDDDDAVAVYEISFKSGKYEYDYEINAVTGAVVKHEKEAD